MGVLAFVLQLPVLVNPQHFVDDDPRFYVVIAEHLAAGHGSTFNGLVPTNGYHPLWMVVVTALALAFDGDALLWAAVAGSVALFAVAVALVHAVVVRLDLGEPGAAVATAAIGFLGTTGFLSEMALSAALLGGCLVAMIRVLVDGREDRGAFLALGAGLGLLALSRLDAVFFVAAALGVTALRSPRGAVWSGAATAACLAPYLAWNLVNFGHLMPISGAIKSSFPAVVWTGVAHKLGPYGIGSALAGAAALALSATIADPRRALLAALGAGTLTQAVYVGLFTRSLWHTHWI